MTVTPSREEEIKAVWKEYTFFYQVLGALLLIGVGVLIGAILFSAPTDRVAYNINLYTSILSILVTVFVIDLLNRRRATQSAIKELKEELVRDASSIVNDVANNAIHQMRKRDWLAGDNGLLIGADLNEANLQGANLMFANLHGAYLLKANLHGADLFSAELQGAKLMVANLHGAYLVEANLHGADLWKAEFDEKTILPNGTHWTPDTDMRKFTQLDNEDGAE